MNKGIITLSVLVFLVLFTAKSEEINSNGFIFPEYQKGKVYFQSNEVTEALLNYETLSKQMLFMQNDQALVLGFPHATDSVVIANRVFVYYKNNEFFEKISVGNGDVYIQYNSTQITDAKEAGYGGYSQLSNTKSLSNISTLDGGQTHSLSRLSTKERFRLKMVYQFWIKRGNRFIKVSTRGQIIKAFPDKKQKIQYYLDAHKINFESIDGIKSLVNYCFSAE